ELIHAPLGDVVVGGSVLGQKPMDRRDVHDPPSPARTQHPHGRRPRTSHRAEEIDFQHLHPIGIRVLDKIVSFENGGVVDEDIDATELLFSCLHETFGCALKVSVGGIKGLASINRNFPQSGSITVGQTVVWTVPPGFEAHTVNFPIPLGGYVSSQATIK